MNVLSPLTALASRPEATTEFLSACLAEVRLEGESEYSDGAHLARAVASHPAAAPADLVHLSGFELTRGKVAKNPSAPVGALLALLATHDATILGDVLVGRVWAPEVTAWVRARMRRSSELSRVILARTLENRLTSPELVVEAMDLALTHPAWGESSDEDSAASLSSMVRHRLRSDEALQERWALSLEDPKALRILFQLPSLSVRARERCWDLGVVAVQRSADAVFWRSNPREVLPPLARELVNSLQWPISRTTGPEGAVFAPLVLELLRSHDVRSVPYGDVFVAALERSERLESDELLVLARSSDHATLCALGSRRSLPTDVALELVGSRYLSTEMALEFSARHLMHDLSYQALDVRSWDRAFVVGTLTRRPGCLKGYPVDVELGLEVLEGLSARARGTHSDYRLVPDHLSLVPRGRWRDLSWHTVRAALPYSPELASEALSVFSEAFPDASGWEVLTRLVVECPDFPGTLGELAASVGALTT